MSAKYMKEVYQYNNSHGIHYTEVPLTSKPAALGSPVLIKNSYISAIGYAVSFNLEAKKISVWIPLTSHHKKFKGLLLENISSTNYKSLSSSELSTILNNYQ